MTEPNDLTVTGEEASLPLLTPAFAKALVYTVDAHDTHRRKGTESRRAGGRGVADGVPYVSHLLEVAALVMDAGGDEDAAIAGLLHDVVEDRGGEPRLNDLRTNFGDLVAEVVLECSDSTNPDQKRGDYWFDRKRAHVRHVETVNFRTLLVLAADKISNARAIIADALTQLDDGQSGEVFTHFRPYADAVAEGRGASTPPRPSDPFFKLTGATVPASTARAVVYSATCTLWYYRSVHRALLLRSEQVRYAPLRRLVHTLGLVVVDLEEVMIGLGVSTKQVDKRIHRDEANGWIDPVPIA